MQNHGISCLWFRRSCAHDPDYPADENPRGCGACGFSQGHRRSGGGLSSVLEYRSDERNSLRLLFASSPCHQMFGLRLPGILDLPKHARSTMCGYRRLQKFCTPTIRYSAKNWRSSAVLVVNAIWFIYDSQIILLGEFRPGCLTKSFARLSGLPSNRRLMAARC